MVVFWILLACFFVIYYESAENMVEQSTELFVWIYSFSILVVLYLGTMGLLQRKIYRPDSLVVETDTVSSQDKAADKPDVLIPVKTDKYKKIGLEQRNV